MSGTCVLTFDDGPSMAWTPRVLAELSRCRVRATFFVDTSRVRGAAGMIAAMLAAGHDVELHCHRHRRHSTLSEDELERDTRAALQALTRVGVTPSRWRAPWGVCTPATSRIAERHGLQLVGWTIDTHDWRGDSARDMLHAARAELADNSLVLMHDALGPGARRRGCGNTVALIEPLVRAARERALRLVPLSAVAAGA
jgi:peptidoglycan-N-acetylglucosamine deacetylase